MSEQFRLNVIGQAGSGKSTLVSYLSEVYGFAVFRPSDTIRDYARGAGITLASRQNYVDAHVAMINDNPRAIIDPILRHPAPRLCLDGLRAPFTARALQREVGLHILALACPAETRFARVMQAADRQGRDSSTVATLEGFIADEGADTQADPHLPNVDAIMAMANVTIDASQPFPTVQAEADRHLAQLGINPCS